VPNQRCAESWYEFIQPPIILEDNVKRVIEIQAFLQDMSGVTISYDGKVVAEYLNTMEAFITLAGMLDGGPQKVKLTMPEVSESFEHHFDAGRRAVAQAATRPSKKKLKLATVEPYQSFFKSEAFVLD